MKNSLLTRQKVFRLERKDGTGPYVGNFDAQTWFEHTKEDHPSPGNDSLLKKTCFDKYGWFKDEYTKYSFGFANLAQFKNWFKTNEVLKTLVNNKYMLSIYEIDAKFLIIGSKQIMFMKEKAILLDRVSVLKLNGD